MDWFRPREDDHGRVEALLSAYLDGQTSDAERTLVERHIETCERCRRSLAMLRATVESVRAMPHVRAPRSFALRAEYGRQRKPAGGIAALYPVLRVATALSIFLFVLSVVGDLISIRLGAPAAATTAMTQPGAPAQGMLSSSGTDSSSLPAPVPPANAAPFAPPLPTPAEPPSETPIAPGGLGAGGAVPESGGGAPPTVTLAASADQLRYYTSTPGEPPALPAQPAPQPQLRSSAPITPGTVTLEPGMDASWAVTSATPMSKAAAPAAQATAAPIQPGQSLQYSVSPSVTSANRGQVPLPYPPAAASPPVYDRQAVPVSAPPYSPLRLGEIGLGVLAVVLGAVTWVAHRQRR